MNAETNSHIDAVTTFASGLKQGYLGRPDVVSDLVGGFSADIFSMLQKRADGTMSSSEFVKAARLRIDALGTVFAGQNDDYPSVIGWNSVSLPAQLKVALSSFWSTHRAEYGDDPCKVYFAWLVWAIGEAMKQEDPDLVDIKMAGLIKDSVRLLIGIPQG